jgi:sterol desaturase/sphingolipid hydroxylase (fatty acid hydroxylase superfamily)
MDFLPLRNKSTTAKLTRMAIPHTYFGYLFNLSSRYLIIAGVAFILFYILFSKLFNRVKIQKIFPHKNDYLREILFSFSTIIIFALYALSLHSSYIKPHTRIYNHISDHSRLYFFASIFLALLIHDTYFYWTHRAMHHPRLFKLFHLTHHRSTNPSPWAAYAFNPLEAVVEGGVILVIAFIIPIHPLAIAAFIITMLVYNVYGHLGYELYPKWFVKSRLGKWVNTGTNHNMHHKYFKHNYGIYFRFWDEAMKTTNPQYEETIDELLTKNSSQRNSIS